MDPKLVEYIGFVVAALILGWAVVELRRRYFRQKKTDSEQPNTWVKLDSTLTAESEESVLIEDSEEEKEEVLEPDIHTRAQQNGHHSESKKLL
jgi:hypothetical protein